MKRLSYSSAGSAAREIGRGHFASARSWLHARCPAAESFLAEVAAPPHSRVIAAIGGAGGSGKSALLDDLERHYVTAGLMVTHDYRELDEAPDRWDAVLIDDAQLLTEGAVDAILHAIDRGDASIIVAYRLWPQPDAATRLVSVLERHHPPVVLGVLDEARIAVYLADALQTESPRELVGHIAQLTAGMPWLVDKLIEEIGRRNTATPIEPEIVGAVVRQLGLELERLGTNIRELLLALAVGFDLSERLPQVLTELDEDINALVAQARAAGLLLADGRLVPIVQRAVLESFPAYRVHAAAGLLLGDYPTGEQSLEVARGLARGGLSDSRVGQTLERAADEVLESNPSEAATLYDEAVAAGADHVPLAARRAQAALAGGDLDGAGRILDSVLVQDDAPDLTRAVDVAAAVWAHRGMLGHSADLYEWLSPQRAGPSGSLAAVAMIATGDRAGAQAMRAVPATSTPTLASVAIRLMGAGIVDSVEKSNAQALPALVRASDMMTAARVAIPMPEYPATLAALVALHSGELDVAESVLDAALSGGQGAALARPRLLLLRGWASMQRDRLTNARATMAEAAALPLTPRDRLLLSALEVAIARRDDDAPGLARAWHKAREVVLHVPVDLFSLLPISELVVAALQMREPGRLDGHLADAWQLLGRLGDPPLWSTRLRWSGVESAIVSERPEELVSHATALAEASRDNTFAGALAAAATAWVSVLAGGAGASSVESAARGLASVGLPWDGARLAGHAAARTDDRKDIARLLSCARDLHPTPAQIQSAPTAEPTGSVAARGPRANSSLSARELEVARLVVDGKTYREIGEAMFVSPRTAEHHIARIRNRLGVTTRSDLLARLRLVLADDEPS